MAMSYMTAVALMIFSSVVVFIIKFDVQLSIDSVHEPIIIHPFIYYDIVCLFRHTFIKNSTLMCLFSNSIRTRVLFLYNFHADISSHYNDKKDRIYTKIVLYTYNVNWYQEFQHPRVTKQSDITRSAFFL